VEERPDITLLLRRAHEGDRDAIDEVARAVEADLARRARGIISGQRRAGKPVSLEPTDLVNETFLKLLQQRTRYRDRRHFFAIATRIMLRVLMDYHKARMRQKRAGGRIRISLSALGSAHAVKPDTDVPLLVEALEKLEHLDPRACRVLKLRALWGLSVEEIGEVLAVSRSTVDRDWKFARTWLAANL
jgi:RNA polymerase sigma-70 factor (ECF subfamily)